MGRITDEDIARVRDATDVVSLISERLVLRPKGRLFWGLCPFHGEKTPSFKVDPSTQLWHCFGCGKGGDAFGFVMGIENVDFPDAVRLLADRANVEIHEQEGGVPRGAKDRLYAALDEAASFYHRMLTGSRDVGPTTAREYLAGRGFGSEVAKAWRLGFAPGRGALVRHLTEKGFSAEEMVSANLALKGDGGMLKDRFYERIMFPIWDLQGRVVAFGGRVLGSGEPKYLNTNDTPVFHKSANMYAIDRAKGPITASGLAVVVEGYTDVIALHETGMANVVAALGTAFTPQHAKLLGRFARRVVFLFDGDAAGQRAASRVAELVDAGVTPEAGSSRVELEVAIIPGGADPAEYAAASGREGLDAVIAGAVPLLRYAIDMRLARWDLDRPEERARALKDAAEVLAPIKDSLLADDYANYIADRLFADFQTVRRVIATTRPAASRQPSDEAGVDVTEAPEILSPRVRVERELLVLMITVPSLRSRARELLANSLLADPSHAEIAELIAQAGDAVSGSALIGSIDQHLAGSAEALSAFAVDESGLSADTLADDLTRRLKEMELERRIAVGKARLKQPGSAMNPADYDEVFREVSVLQRELDSLRRSATDSGL